MRCLYCDESIWVPIADGLERRGRTTRLAGDEGDAGYSRSRAVGTRCRQRLDITDVRRRFLSLVEGEELTHAGLIYVKQGGRRIEDVVKVVDVHLEERDEDDRGIQYL